MSSSKSLVLSIGSEPREKKTSQSISQSNSQYYSGVSKEVSAWTTVVLTAGTIVTDSKGRNPLSELVEN